MGVKGSVGSDVCVSRLDMGKRVIVCVGLGRIVRYPGRGCVGGCRFGGRLDGLLRLR